MFELTEVGRGVVEALVAAPVAWQSPAELSRATGLDAEETADVLAALDVGGWLTAWEREVDIVVTLSVAAASSLGVRLVEIGPEEVPRWARAGDPRAAVAQGLGRLPGRSGRDARPGRRPGPVGWSWRPRRPRRSGPARPGRRGTRPGRRSSRSSPGRPTTWEAG